MDLKLHLLIRMTLMGLLCWLGVSIYLVGQSGRRAAEEAYALFRQHRPDVVVTDLAMPGASGLEAIRRILSADAAARVLVFSMHVSPDLALAAIRAGALGYITKSSPPDVLLRAIAEVLA